MSRQQPPHERYLERLTERARENQLLTFILGKIKECKGNPQAVYALGLKFRDGDVDGFDHEKESEYALEAAFECFRFTTAIYESAGDKRPYLRDNFIQRVWHNIAMIFYTWKQYDSAELFFEKAAALNLAPSKANLDNLRAERAKAERKAAAQQQQGAALAAAVSGHTKRAMHENLSAAHLAQMVQRSLDRALTRAGHGEDSPIRQQAAAAGAAAAAAGAASMDELLDELKAATADFVSDDPHRVESAYRLVGGKQAPTPAEIQASLLSEGVLQELKRVALDLFEKTKDTDCILFLGRSPLLVYEMFIALGLQRKTKCIPFSGGHTISQASAASSISPEAEEGLKAFLRSRGLDRSFFDTDSAAAAASSTSTTRLVIFDRVETGNSVQYFLRKLSEIDPRFSNSIVMGFGDVTTWDIKFDNPDNEFLPMSDEALHETCRKHAENLQYSLGVDFYPAQWHEWEQKDFNLELSQIARARQQQIQAWERQNRPTLDDDDDSAASSIPSGPG